MTSLLGQAGTRVAALGSTVLFGLSTGQVAAQEAKADFPPPTSLRADKSSLEGIEPGEKALVAWIDEQFGKGALAPLLDRFEGPCGPARKELQGRLILARAGKGRKRQSKILSREARGRFRALLLEVDLASPVVAATGSSQIHELLILRKDEGEAPRPLYLLETTPDWLKHVQGMLDGRRRSGLVLGAGTYFTCPACNYRVTLPETGHWVLYPRPRHSSGQIEAVQIFHLEKDLSLDLGLVVAPRRGLGPDQRAMRVRRLMLHSLPMLAGRKQRTEQTSAMLPDKIHGMDAWTCTVMLRNEEEGQRFYKLYGMPHSALDYMLSVQGAAKLLEDRDRIGALLGTFSLQDPMRSEEEGWRKLEQMMGAVGRFDGDSYHVDSIGLRLPGPKGWSQARHVDKELFQASWDCPGTGSVMQVFGVRRTGADWNGKVLAEWIDRLIENQKKLIPCFRHERLKKTKVAGRTAYEIRFRYRCEQRGGRSLGSTKGSFTLIPAGRVLVVISCRSAPGKAQDRLLEVMGACLSDMRLAGR